MGRCVPPCGSCAAALLCLLAVGAQLAADAAIVVIVRVATGVRRDLVDAALREAARIYQRGHMVIRWTDVHDAPHALWLNVIARDDLQEPGKRPRLGIAPRAVTMSGRITYVFVQPVEDLARRSGADPALVLGAAIAHELAHQLLPDGRHSAAGLMQVKWGRREAAAASRGELRFSAQQFSDMRAHLDGPAVALARRKQ